MTLRPLHLRVFCAIQEHTHEGMIELPPIAQIQRDYRLGAVRHVDPGVPDVKVGDLVILDFGGNWASIDGEMLAVVREGNVLGRIDHE